LASETADKELDDTDDPPASGISSSSEKADNALQRAIKENPDFFQQGIKLAFSFTGLQASYLTWGYMQELIMTSVFEPTAGAVDGKFPSAGFCVFSNRLLAVLVAMVAVKIKHGAVLANNVAPLWAYTPAAISNTVSSTSQYASLRYVSFPVQTVFKSSKIIAVMIMGKVLKGSSYPWSQYVESCLITTGES
jgi:adenosine 3'-phospho 5'-phosphosulfate transporter B2